MWRAIQRGLRYVACACAFAGFWLCLGVAAVSQTGVRSLELLIVAVMAMAPLGAVVQLEHHALRQRYPSRDPLWPIYRSAPRWFHLVHRLVVIISVLSVLWMLFGKVAGAPFPYDALGWPAASVCIAMLYGFAFLTLWAVVRPTLTCPNGHSARSFEVLCPQCTERLMLATRRPRRSLT